MRVTNNMIINGMLRNLNNNLARLEKYNTQLATGKKVQRPSDDPVRVSKALSLRTDLSRLEQYEKNANNAMSWLEVTESAVAEIGDLLQRARELTVRAATGSLNPEDKSKIADELNQLKKQLISAANTSYAGRYIFSGFKTDTKFLDNDGNYNFTITSSYIEGMTKTIAEIGIGDSIEINTNGLELFPPLDNPLISHLPFGKAVNKEGEAVVSGIKTLKDSDITNEAFKGTQIIIEHNGVEKRITIGELSSEDLDGLIDAINSAIDLEFTPGSIIAEKVDSGDGENFTIQFKTNTGTANELKVDVVRATKNTLISDFEEAIEAMISGDEDKINEFLGKIDGHIDRILSIRSDIGSRVNRLELVLDRIDENKLTYTKLLSDNEDADLAEVIINLTTAENVYRASLSAGARIIQPTLIDFIR